MADWLHRTFGGDIRLLQESKKEGEKRADYLWNGKLWDLKTASTEKAANSALRHGLQQIRENPGGILLDYRGRNIDIGILLSVIAKRMQWRKDISAVDVAVILNHSFHIWRY